MQGARSCRSGRDPLSLPDEKSTLEPLGYYRGKLTTFAREAKTWLEGGYSVTLLLRFERTGRYLQEKVLEGVETTWANTVTAQPGKLTFVVGADTRGGYRDAQTKEIVLTEDLLYGYQGSRPGGTGSKKLPGRRVQDTVQLSVGDYLIHTRPRHRALFGPRAASGPGRHPRLPYS